MTTQNFVGNKAVDNFPPEATKKLSEEEIQKLETQRDPSQQGGSATRAGVATRDPSQFDAEKHDSHGDPKPVQEPVL